MPEPMLQPDHDAEEIAAYLRRHPRFLEAYPDLAAELVMPRERGRAASLAAWQLETLRERNSELDGRLVELIAIAGDNEQLMIRVHTLTTGLLRDDNLVDMCTRFVAALHEDFRTELVRLVLFRDVDGLPDADWALCIPDGAAVLPAFTEFLARREPECGRLARVKLERLFGAAAGSVQSAALVGIGDAGMLAIGSHDANRFHPGIGTLFLKLIAQALEAAISRFPPGKP